MLLVVVGNGGNEGDGGWWWMMVDDGGWRWIMVDISGNIGLFWLVVGGRIILSMPRLLFIKKKYFSPEFWRASYQYQSFLNETNSTPISPQSLVFTFQTFLRQFSFPLAHWYLSLHWYKSGFWARSSCRKITDICFCFSPLSGKRFLLLSIYFWFPHI